ncbi:MAG TPA: FKBP-type peptidyl-prolyl cis-trans isomerase [Gammaproteobacteria bacterium]|nr:FKBP-type peptidyl-prolyl cis-trans isomerase [Gammaproteobacteria bacterium]
MRTLPVVLVMSLALGAAAHAQTLSTEQDKTLYALGILVGSQMKSLSLTPAELATVQAGMSDIVAGKEPKVDLDTYGPKVQAFAQGRQAAAEAAEEKEAAAAAGPERQAGAAFLDKLAKEPNATRSSSGVVYVPVKVGTGASPSATSSVKVHYHGTLRDGTVFDSSVQRGEPVTFPLNQVISCWTEGVQKMKVGGKAKLGCPADTAYGDRKMGSIPAGAALLFEVELLDIED